MRNNRIGILAAWGFLPAILSVAAMGQVLNKPRWPAVVTTDYGTVTVFQPQLEDFQGQTLKGRAAVSIQPAGQEQPIFGAIWIESRVAVDRVARTVQVLDVNITRSRFPDGTPNQDALTNAVKQVFTGHQVTLSLDQLLTMLQTVQQQNAAATELKNEPPKIIFLDHPAIKIQYDGPPRLVQADNGLLMKVVNTPFFVVLNPADKTYYLKGAGTWFMAPDPMGPFQSAVDVPAEVSGVAAATGYADPQQAIIDAQAATAEIVTATEPTELIWTDGPAQMGTIPGTDLLYVTNTDSDVFMDIQSQRLYVLLSGRWYTAANHQGPWTFIAANQLPADFSHIPPDSDKGNVLAHVAGTQAAQDAVADSYVPQTAGVNLHQFDQPPVEYDGTPQFQPVEGTSMSYAANTDAAVLLVNGQYYCCFDGVWYYSGSPNGPWQLSLSVPPVIYTIPPSCPIYSVRYCYVYGHTNDLVYCGYLPGYAGSYVYDGVVVYGTGWYYRPWIGVEYCPRPWTFGFAARYNCYNSHWGFDFGIRFGGGRGWIGNHPGRFVRSGGNWFGLGGFRPVYRHDAPHDTAAQRESAFGEAQRDVYHRSVYDHRNDVHHDVFTAPRIDVQRPAGRTDDVYTDRNGQIYRRTIDGWEQRQQNTWRPAEPVRPAAPAPRAPEVQPRQDFGDLNRDYRARVSGNERDRAEQQAPPPRQEPPPRNEGPSGGGRDNGGGGGGRSGGGGGRGR